MNYEELLGLLKYRRSIRILKPEPIPDDYIMKILDAARYAMSGANSQPWEFLVVKDRRNREKLYEAYLKDFDMMYHLEQQRAPKYRHPAFKMRIDERDRALQMFANWKDAPVYICVLEDPRKMFGSVLAARSDFCSASHSILATTMGHLSMTIQLAVASLGLGSQRVDVFVQEPYRQILGYPEPLRLNIIVPVGYRTHEPGPPHRLPLKELVHFERYDMNKYMRSEDFLEYLGKIRKLGKRHGSPRSANR